MKRLTMKNQVVDIGARYVVRDVTSVEVDLHGVTTGFAVIDRKRRSVRKHFPGPVDPEDLEPWTLTPPADDDGYWFAGPLIGVIFEGSDDSFTWENYEAGDVPETDEIMYRLLDGEGDR